MTIGTAGNRVSFNCDGATTVFPIPLQAYLAGDFDVWLTAPAAGGGTQTRLTLNSDFSLTKSGTLAPTYWTLTTLGAVPYQAGYSLTALVDPNQVQQTNYVQGQSFPSLAVETNLDRLTQMVQRLQDQVSRAIRAPDGDITPGMLLPPAPLRALQYLAFDAAGNVTPVVALPGSGVTPQSIGIAINPRSPAEIAAGVVPVNYWFPVGDVRRYGAVGNGATDDTAAITAALLVCNFGGNSPIVFAAGCTFKITSYMEVYSNTTIFLYGTLQLTGRQSGLFTNGGNTGALTSNVGIYGFNSGIITDTTVAGNYLWNAASVVAPAIHIRSSQNVVVSGINFFYVSQGTYVSAAGQNYGAATGFGAGAGQAGSSNVTLENNSYTFTEFAGTSAIQAQLVRYLNNYYYRCGDSGCWVMGCGNCEIIGNVRTGPKTVYADVVTYGGGNLIAHPTTWNDVQGISIQASSGVLCANNQVSYMQGQGIDVKESSSRVLVTGNLVSFCEQTSICTRAGDAGNTGSCAKVTIANNTITDHGTIQFFNTAQSALWGAISASSTYLTEISNNVIYSYQLTPGINCTGPGTYQDNTFGSNPQQGALTVIGNSFDFKNPQNDGDASSVITYTAATPTAIRIAGEYTSVKCDANHIKTDKYYFADARVGTVPAIALTYVTGGVGSTYYPTSASVNGNEVQGWGFTGIQVTGLPAMSASGLTVNNNTVGCASGYGISLMSTNFAVCNGNNIAQQTNPTTSYAGLFLSGSVGNVLQGVTCTGNAIGGGWNTGGNVMQYGLQTYYAANCNCANNTISGFTGSFPVNILNATGNIILSGTTGFPRSGNASPNGSVFSYYLGEMYWDATNLKWWAASNYQSSVWTQLTN